jgi:hypothetical protein
VIFVALELSLLFVAFFWDSIKNALKSRSYSLMDGIYAETVLKYVRIAFFV